MPNKKEAHTVVLFFFFFEGGGGGKSNIVATTFIQFCSSIIHQFKLENSFDSVYIGVSNLS